MPASVVEPPAFTTILLSPISNVVAFTIVLVPFTVKFPDTTKSLLTVTFEPVISSLFNVPSIVTLLNWTFDVVDTS